MSGGGSSGEKTELPTPKKERDARQKGQVARSQEVVTTISLSSVIAYLWFTWGGLNTRLTGMFDQAAKLAEGDFRTSAVLGVHAIFWDSMMILAPLLGIVILAGIAANYFQVGSLFTFEPIMPKGEKINPASGFKRIFSMKQVFEFLKSVVKIVVLSSILYFVIRDAIAPFVDALSCGTNCLLDITVTVLGQTLIYSVLAFVVVAVADFAYQKRSHTKSLMMTKEEVKREYKESEGDPHIKGKRKQLAQEFIMSDGAAAARKGTAVIVNPTHFAVVIDYKLSAAVTAREKFEAEAKLQLPLYLLAVFFPQSSTFRLLVPMFPALGAFAVPRSPWYRVGIVLLFIAGQWGWIHIGWGGDGHDWTPP